MLGAPEEFTLPTLTKFLRSCLWPVLLTVATAARCDDALYTNVSKCFFVYGPIIDVAKNVGHRDLFTFAQARIGYVAGFLRANEASPRFKQIFEGNLTRNKAAGRQLESRLSNAIQSGSETLYKGVIQEAIACDRQLGIRTEFIPPLRSSS